MQKLPKSVPHGNNHNIILHVQKGDCDDANRLNQIGGEGLIAARRALAAMADLPPEIERDHRETVRDIRRWVSERRIFLAAFREVAVDFIAAMDLWRARNGDDPDVMMVHAFISQALEASELVEDYLSADRAINDRRYRRKIE
jgi:hypothetical protein